eukprot:scaffold337235_cov32-Prasinocladus_malaysianus.AAC.1
MCLPLDGMRCAAEMIRLLNGYCRAITKHFNNLSARVDDSLQICSCTLQISKQARAEQASEATFLTCAKQQHTHSNS